MIGMMPKRKKLIYTILVATAIALSSKGGHALEVVRMKTPSSIQVYDHLKGGIWRTVANVKTNDFVILTGRSFNGRQEAEIQNGPRGYLQANAQFIRDEKTYSNSLKYALAKDLPMEADMFLDQFLKAWGSKLSPKAKIGGMGPTTDGDKIVWDLSKAGGRLAAAQVRPDGSIHPATRTVKDRSGKIRIVPNVPAPKGSAWLPIELSVTSSAFPVPMGLAVGSDLRTALQAHGNPKSKHRQIGKKENAMEFIDNKGARLTLYYRPSGDRDIITRVDYKRYPLDVVPIQAKTLSTYSGKMKMDTDLIIVEPPKKEDKPSSGSKSSKNQNQKKKAPAKQIRRSKGRR